jgi:hypothetical protein
MAGERGYCLWGMVRQKMNANKDRPYKHGKISSV